MAHETGCKHFTLVSTKAADKNSMFYMLKTKVKIETHLKRSHAQKFVIKSSFQGLTEEHVNEISFERTTILRPG